MFTIKSSKPFVTNPIPCILSGNTNIFLSCTSTWLLEVILVNSNLNKMKINEIISYGRINKIVHQPCYRHLFYIFCNSVMPDLWESEQWACRFMMRDHFPKLYLLCGLTTASLGNLGFDYEMVIPHISGTVLVSGSLQHFWLSSPLS